MAGTPVILAPRGSTRPPFRPPISRMADRRITALGIGLAAMFVILAGLSLLLSAELRQGWWLPLHLLLAGAAATAIAGVMPFFSTAVTMAPPAPAPLRLAGVLGVATGALLVATARVVGAPGDPAAAWLGGLGGLLYLAGLAAVGMAVLLPLRRALGPRRWIMGASYGLAVVSVMLGATLGALFLVGWAPALAAWDVLRPAHAWVNAFGFVSLVIGATLLHLLPTVTGARIARTRAAEGALLGLAAGPLVAALGFLLRSDLLAAGGALVTLGGSLALAAYAFDVSRRRGHWTTDLGWHRFAQRSLLAAPAWFVAACSLAAWSVAHGGASIRGWEPRAVVAPLALGWVAQALAGAWTHLVPSVGPGDPLIHARQRAILGRAGTVRFGSFQAGTAALAVGLPLGMEPLAIGGLALVVASLGASLALLAVAATTLLPGTHGAATPPPSAAT